MTEFLRVLVVFVAAVNPLAVGLAVRAAADVPAARRLFAAALAAVVAWAVVLVLALAADSIIDFLAIEPETWRMAAGLVLLLAGGRVLLLARREEVTPTTAAWFAALVAFPVLIIPEVAAAAVTYGIDTGAGKTAGAAAVALALGGAVAAIPRFPRDGAGATAARAGARLTAAVLMVMAVALIVDGVRDI